MVQTHIQSHRVTRVNRSFFRLRHVDLEDCRPGVPLAFDDDLFDRRIARQGTMRKHPAYAHDLISPIAFLRPALDIPYCHHERWDGSGYPLGLKGEAIPLVARAFAVVDVWDALCSDRPYRLAWSKDQVYDYLRAEAGKQFDAPIVSMFLGIIDGERSA